MAESALIMEALYYGVPLLLFTETGEQRAMAHRVERTGVGLSANIEELQEQIGKITDSDSN